MDKKLFPFVQKKKIWYAISLIIIIAGIISLCVQGINAGIDFTGGNLYQVQFSQSVNSNDIAGVVNEYVDVTPSIQETGDNEYTIRINDIGEEKSAELLAALEAELGTIDVVRNDRIGPVIGAELLSNAKWALIIAFALMLIYITVRFRFQYALAAIIPLLHDVLVTVAFVSILQIEVDSAFVAALLTILGYSINATIVIFDRVRENIGYGIRGSFGDVVNLSINQTLGRSINTVVAVLLLIISLFLFGGDTTKEFVLTLFIGVVAGGYSSVFIAGPMLVDISKHIKTGSRPSGNKKAKKRVKTA